MCKGSGVIKIHAAPENRKNTEIDEDSYCYRTLVTAGCLFWLGYEIAHKDDMEYKNREMDREIRDIENHEAEDPAIHVERSATVKRVKCPRCNGTGWISKSDYDTPAGDNNDIDFIIRRNDELKHNKPE